MTATWQGIGVPATTDWLTLAPVGAPDAPSGVTVNPGDGQLTVNFTLGSDGGSAISAIQYQHDQTLRWANRGLAKDEIAQRVRLPEHLESWSPWMRPFWTSRCPISAASTCCAN